MMEQPSKRWPAYIATLGGIGRARYAPGTVASLISLPLAFAIRFYTASFGLMIAAVLASAIGAWACDLYMKRVGKADPSECVIDELAGQWLACAGICLTPTYPSVTEFALAFLLFRLFDILKTWPISAAEKLPGGLGVMADDMVAGLAAAIIAGALQYFRVV